MRRKERPPVVDHRAPWQIEQAARCGCRGTDDMCVCQNDENAWAKRETAWLVEMVHNTAPIPRYWNNAPNKGWVWGADEAMRFCREQDAKDFISGERCLSGKAVEHVFIGQSLPDGAAQANDRIILTQSPSILPTGEE